jgi:hypothetical protein
MPDEPLTIWGLPVVVKHDLTDNEIVLLAGGGVVRQDGVLEWKDGVLVVKNIGEPYDA